MTKSPKRYKVLIIMSQTSKMVIVVLATTIVVGSTVYLWQNKKINYITAMTAGAVKYNCELSQGKYQNGVCECPHSPEIGQTSESMYSKDTGFCQTDHGGAGGDAFYAESGLPYGDYEYYYNVVTYNCEKSGGRFWTGFCTCPTTKTLDKTTGFCK